MCKRLHNICLRYIFRYFNQKGLKQLHFYGNIVTELLHVIQERDEGAGTHISSTPCKGKSFINFSVSFKAFALTGRQVCEHDNPGRCPGLRASALSGRAASMSFCPLPMLSAGDRWLRACRVISTVQVTLFSVSYEIVLSLADKSIFRDTECTFQITEWRFRTTECTFRVTERNFL